MKRWICALLALLCILGLSGCGSVQIDVEDVKSAAYDDGYKDGYEKGYDIGKDAGYDAGYEDGYAAGKADAKDMPPLAAAAAPSLKSTEPDYVLNTNSKKFHYPWCNSVQAMKAKNRRDFYGTREEAIEKGYVACKNCNP